MRTGQYYKWSFPTNARVVDEGLLSLSAKKKKENNKCLIYSGFLEGLSSFFVSFRDVLAIRNSTGDK
jgi:hypothetical protein